ncbi:MAG: 3-deoxy-D-manno-octulosonic acid transferase [Candidatus Omnitrophica bacterium]|nr:3-deoxy-D-manno-octulosonic acid transferase [Candidatus Omnitrophota bacterium]MBU4302925.1 3-deoxy-D-manno-octulosonic acid transferase [Candidatus Omnitrophota bacterium]MBU4419239.1 3-deoxy-D-manno-octulosonic acid transferase [Candidatus Omnitrophota bacterium]MBU4467361.1 3-deoxy-D-manno-octulosonic acid transferase [Candidatus Omnitrophota bacterium]MCG2708453.1 3-deoxy-D-manno-octulosonic acid transferase [Candidatus Omnitrophota bacterium]
MSIIYDLVFLIFTVLYFPLYFLRGKFNSGFLRRLGFLPAQLNLDRPIWIHAVSVGEAIAVKGLASQLRQAYPGKKLVISTVTATGNKIAQGLVKEGDFLTYLPLDFSFIVRHVLKRINPCMFIIAETEIWPNLITCLDKLQVPVVTVNGRISDSSYGGYQLIKFFIRPILRMVKQFCVQSDLDAWRLESLGVDKQRIQVTGNVKFDINLDPPLELNVLTYRSKLGLGQADKLLVCGSTHPGEEELIFAAYSELLLAFPNLKLLIAPRHPERSEKISRLAADKGFMPVLISGISGACPTCIQRAVFILDTIGELVNYYSAADIVFVGGSMVKRGGHNILEPASLMKPIIFGPHMFNFRDISELFLANQAALVASDSRELVHKVKEILNNNLLAKGLVQRAYELIIKNRGATPKNIQIIKQLSQDTPR